MWLSHSLLYNVAANRAICYKPSSSWIWQSVPPAGCYFFIEPGDDVGSDLCRSHLDLCCSEPRYVPQSPRSVSQSPHLRMNLADRYLSDTRAGDIQHLVNIGQCNHIQSYLILFKHILSNPNHILSYLRLQVTGFSS